MAHGGNFFFPACHADHVIEYALAGLLNGLGAFDDGTCIDINDRMDLEKQKEKLSRTFDEWKGTLEQVDDVTIIGIRI